MNLAFKRKMLVYKIASCFLFKKTWRRRLDDWLGICAYKKLRDGFVEVKTKKINFEKNFNNFKSVFLGSSHVAYGFNPAFYHEAYNLGSSSQDLFTSYRLLGKIVEYKNIKNIFVEYSVFSNGFDLAYTKNERHVPSCYRYLYEIEYEKLNYVENYKTLLKDIENSVVIDINKNNGYLSPSAVLSAPSVQEREKAHMREHERANSKMFYYNNINQLAKKNNIKLYVVTFPVRSDLIKAFPDKDYLFKEINRMSKDLGFTYLNFYDDPEFDWDDFWDYDHLNESGAEKFTKKLKAVVESIEQ